jgi:hypothetical protein
MLFVWRGNNRKNKTVEHIIPNAIGGRLTSKNLICKNCNSKFGASADAELAKQLNPFLLMLDIKRDRGKPQPVLVRHEPTGQYYNVDSKGNAVLKDVIVKKDIENKRFKIRARTIPEMKRILQGLNKKYDGNINIDELLSKVEFSQGKLDNEITTNIGIGEEIFPAILKIALNYYIFETGNIDVVQSSINSLKNNKIGKVEIIDLENRMYDLDDDELTHSVYIYGSKTDGKLYAVIELFNYAQFVVKLSEEYDMPDYEDLFVFDILKNTESKKKINYHLPSNFVFDYRFKSCDFNPQFIMDRGERILRIIKKKKQNAQIISLVDNACNEAIQKFQSGELNKDDANKFFRSKIENGVLNYLMSRI